MRALLASLQSLSRRDLVALSIEIGAVALLLGAAAGAAEIGAVLIRLAEAGGL